MASTAEVRPESDPNQGAGDMLLRRTEGRIAFLTLNRPDHYNTLSIALMETLLETLAEIDRDPDIACIVIEGAGRGFCGGHDLKEMQATPTRAFRETTFATCSKLMLSLTRLRQPVIAKIHGGAAAAGCQLVAACDLAIAADDAKFGTPGINLGLFCSTPMVALSRTVSRKHAMEMLLTGDLISSAKAVEIGLINRAVPLTDLDAEITALAGRVASKSPLVLKIGKEAFHQQIDLDLAAAYEHCSRVMVDNLELKDCDEGIQAFMEKRPPLWRNE